jgi:hypothetical protein
MYAVAGDGQHLKSMANALDCQQVVRRIGSLTPNSQRLWGVMSVEGMMCHLADSYQVASGERAATPVPTPMPRLMKAVALWTPMPWPKNLPTLKEVEQGYGGSTPRCFEDARVRLLRMVARFCSTTTLAEARHPFFGRMTQADWMRWGYLHADHHLRQFSA